MKRVEVLKDMVVAADRSEFDELLPNVGKTVLALFIHLPKEDFDPFASNLKSKLVKNSDYRVTKHDIPPIVDELAIAVARQNGFSGRQGQRMVGSARVFGNLHPFSGAHVDTNINTDGTQMPVFGSWTQFSGASRVFLREIPYFDSQNVFDEVERLREDTDNPDFELGVKIRDDKIDDFSQIDIHGPAFGVWAVGMSIERNVYTVLHEIRTIVEPRISANLLQNFTNRIY